MGKVECFHMSIAPGFGCRRAGVFICAAHGRSEAMSAYLYRFCTDEARIPCVMNREIMQTAA